MNITPEARAMLEHNEDVANRIACLQKEIEELRATVKAPCAHCPLDGMFRCEACGDALYEGAFDRDYPSNKYTEENFIPAWKRN